MQPKWLDLIVDCTPIPFFFFCSKHIQDTTVYIFKHRWSYSGLRRSRPNRRQHAYCRTRFDNEYAVNSGQTTFYFSSGSFARKPKQNRWNYRLKNDLLIYARADGQHGAPGGRPGWSRGRNCRNAEPTNKWVCCRLESKQFFFPRTQPTLPFREFTVRSAGVAGPTNSCWQHRATVGVDVAVTART